MMRPPNLAFISLPTGTDPHVCMIYRRKDGSTFYGSTWVENRAPSFPRNHPPNAQYLVRIRLKPEAL